jgi:hypothetical protein
MRDLIVQQVSSWSFADEREDDMTMIIAKIMGSDERQRNREG